MEGKATALVFSILLVSLSSTAYSKPLTPSWPESESETLTLLETESETSLTLPLVHRDAFAFNTTRAALLKLRLQRDAARVKTLTAMATAAKKKGANMSSSIISGNSLGDEGEYLTLVGVGTPPQYMYMNLDTGSDVVWIQCVPCVKCYNQTSGPIFNPKKSKTFTPLPCTSHLCRPDYALGCSRRHTCIYYSAYGDNSETYGEFSTETLKFGRTSLPNVLLGCGRYNKGKFSGSAGILGLGRGNESFTSQTSRRFGRKFSYCLVDVFDPTKKSWLMFGDAAVSRTAIFTPLIKNPHTHSVSGTYYYVDLIGMSVGGARVLEITASLFKFDSSGNGGVYIDSGTAVTRLVQPAYIAFRDAFRRAFNLKWVRESGLDTCYDLSKKKVKVPSVVLHFRNADVSLPKKNVLLTDPENGISCLAFFKSDDNSTIIGSIQQQGIRVVFDIPASRIGFAPGSCA